MSLRVEFDETGGPEVLRLRDVEVGGPGPGELRIRVDAFGLNRAEAMFREGRYFYPPKFPSGLGYEAAGVVEAVGDAVTGFAPGDAVAVVPGFLLTDYATYGAHALVPAAAAVHRAPGSDPVTAAAVWMTYLTAYGALAEDGRTEPGDAVLITAASSGVGLAAIQTALRVGAVPIATTRSAEKKRRLLDAGAAHVIVTGTEDPAERVRQITGGRGVRTVLDSVGGPGLRDLAPLVRPGGSLLLYGALDPRPAELPTAEERPGITSRFFTVFEVTQDADRLRRAVAFVREGLDTEALTPLVDRTFDLTEIVEAHRYMESNGQVGKIVVTVRH
ncbi:zinc-dependent alcohol dehydrogenase family protein [Streptomyces sp. MI02-7b]|uniref:zinc-dependent alcohol dehydrogenase family protein n=1 Tax=Streptomyces sp. MI02-7b TaxID=462941 RepID=UPI0029A1BAD1|nr:zinc-dependent alcohol dehydrogenase family protein [Streptomyces sp. MI02-7b]MDX3075993.1 zinc-dependent alcohol dehydrogenase family protein [Streptomyces sp. MI02-7b]